MTQDDSDKPVTVYKAFNADWTCREFQYEVGQTYVFDDEIEMCERGFHAVPSDYSLAVLRYYPPHNSRFAICEASRPVYDEPRQKIVTDRLKILREISLGDLIRAHVDAHSTAATSGYHSTAATSGDHSTAATSGYGGIAIASGVKSAAVATGKSGRASGASGCALFLCERDAEGEILHAWAGIVGRDGIKADTFYTLIDGKPVEVEKWWL